MKETSVSTIKEGISEYPEIKGQKMEMLFEK